MTTYRELDGRLTPEQHALKHQVHEFAKVVLRPTAAALDRLPDPQEVVDRSSALWTALRAAYSHGIHTALIPAEHGGMGLRGVSLHLALEELGWGSADFAAALGACPTLPFAAVERSMSDRLLDQSGKDPIVPLLARHSCGRLISNESDREWLAANRRRA